MKHDIIISGVGGQGILAIAMVLGRACLDSALQVRQSEIHGMAQRGGAVHSHFRLSDSPICSDVIPQGKADMIVAMEPMEALRYLPFIAPTGRIIVNKEPVINIPDYPELELIHSELEKLDNVFLFDGSKIAAEAGVKRALNMAMLGAASAFLPLSTGTFEKAISDQFAGKRADLADKNIAIFNTAREQAASSL